MDAFLRRLGSNGVPGVTVWCDQVSLLLAERLADALCTFLQGVADAR